MVHSICNYISKIKSVLSIKCNICKALCIASRIEAILFIVDIDRSLSISEGQFLFKIKHSFVGHSFSPKFVESFSDQSFLLLFYFYLNK